ncbi:LapA family protein [Actinoplanes aureus]|uniref:DUF1049 domain-containing protein n=1 Tax=Actinoplanes aureus TaxID=2792083 RepID=A0A931C1D3_9ACTN|nr:lipopolysaccharide assembly protein LapA domain-containing protein [Actinoplanes aureus]MBG0561504.1 DUF1049 domain-containing protein [Actinoplanes aureus]
MSDDLRQTPITPADEDPKSPTGRVPRTRTGAAWFGLCVATLFSVVLIVFMLQNTGSVEVTFLGLHGNLPLAMALLIAAVGAALVTMAVGAARIGQLRRLSRRQTD